MNLAELSDKNEITDRIVEFDLTEDRQEMHVYECCDVYFEAHLNKWQVGRWIARLAEMHDQMVG